MVRFFPRSRLSDGGKPRQSFPISLFSKMLYPVATGSKTGVNSEDRQSLRKKPAIGTKITNFTAPCGVRATCRRFRIRAERGPDQRGIFSEGNKLFADRSSAEGRAPRGSQSGDKSHALQDVSARTGCLLNPRFPSGAWSVTPLRFIAR